jgi:hypothetical protein
MVRRWARRRDEGWRRSLAINAVGAVATGIVLVIVAITKFVHGAWIVIAAMPVIITFFRAVHRHYEQVGRSLRAAPAPPPRGTPNTFVLLVPHLGPATGEAIAYLRALRPERVLPLYVGDPEGFPEAARRWPGIAPRLGTLEPLPVDGGLSRSLRAFLRSMPRGDGFVTVVVPEEVAGSSLLHLVRPRSTLWVKLSLLFEAGVVVTNVPLLPGERPAAADAGRPLEPRRNVVLVPVSAVHAATARAVSYATSLGGSEVEALFFCTDPGEEERILEEWVRWGMTVPLSIVDAPFRDLTAPLLAEIRRHTAHRGTVVTVVLPELVVARWWEHLLHNQTALFLKRLLLFEPGVVVTSVPFHLERPPGDGRERQDRPAVAAARR